ncbi:MAG: SDR family oxidoreductase [Gammaproteobacteria bacterium]
MALQKHLVDQVALVTGGARRVGRAVALALAKAGMHVAITYNQSRAEADEVVTAITALGRCAFALQVRMEDVDAAEQMYRALNSRFDRLDVLVNNASIFDPSPFGTITVEQYDRNQAINARAPLMLIQKFAPMLCAHYHSDDPSSPGRIVNFIDIHVMGEPLQHFAAYNSSKAALMEITSTCAIELAPRVTVNAIAPGVVAWADSYSEEMKREYMTRVPLARPGTPEDAAAAVLYLVRDAAYCTGQIIRLDGGRFLT